MLFASSGMAEEGQIQRLVLVAYPIKHVYLYRYDVICDFNIYILCKLFVKYTSSTAQGGGGSFKNKKRIGDWLL